MVINGLGLGHTRTRNKNPKRGDSHQESLFRHLTKYNNYSAITMNVNGGSACYRTHKLFWSFNYAWRTGTGTTTCMYCAFRLIHISVGRSKHTFAHTNCEMTKKRRNVHGRPNKPDRTQSTHNQKGTLLLKATAWKATTHFTRYNVANRKTQNLFEVAISGAARALRNSITNEIKYEFNVCINCCGVRLCFAIASSLLSLSLDVLDKCERNGNKKLNN